MMSGHRIAEGIHSVEFPLGERVSRVFIFVGTHSTVIFDSGCAGDIPAHVLPYMEAARIPRESVSAVVISHGDVDHFGGLSDAEHAFPHAERIAHSADAPLMEVETYLEQRAREFRSEGLDEPQDVIDWSREAASGGTPNRLIVGDITLDLGEREIQVLHVPGHSRGHLAIWDAKYSAVAVSDSILGAYVPYLDGRPSFPPTYRYPADYVASIRRIAHLPAEHILTAHYPTTGHDSGRSLLDRSLSFVDEMQRAIIEAISHAADSMTLAECVSEVGDALATWPREGRDPALAQPIAGHLEDLESRGVLVRSRTDLSRWRLA